MPPRLATRRLLLRPHRAEDLEDVARLWGDPAVVRFIGGVPASRAEAWGRMLRYAGLWALRGHGYWAVEERATGRFLGDVGLADFLRDLEPPLLAPPEAGWALLPEAQGKGYAREAVGAMLAWADRALEVPAVSCMIDPANAASLALACHHGFAERGRAVHRGAAVAVLARPRRGRPASGWT